MGIEAAGLTEVSHNSSGNPYALIHSGQSIFISFILQSQVEKKEQFHDINAWQTWQSRSLALSTLFA